MLSSTDSEQSNDNAGERMRVEPLPGQVALDIEVGETAEGFENFEEWLNVNRWSVDNDNYPTDDEETQYNNVSQSKRAEEWAGLQAIAGPRISASKLYVCVWKIDMRIVV